MRIANLPAAALALTICVLPAFGAGEKEAPVKKPDPGTTVEMPYLIVPMSQDGKLLGYTYISSKLVCSSPDACIAVRDKLAFIQDAFVREVNGKSLSLASDPAAIDQDLLNARLTANARRIVGDRKVVTMMFSSVKYAPLRPDSNTMGGVPPNEQAPAASEAQKGAAGTAGAPSTTAPKDTAVHGDSAQKSRPK
jgi:hypothetical protein